MFRKILSHHAASAFRTRYASSTMVPPKFPPTGIREKQGSTFISRLLSSNASNEQGKMDASTSNIPLKATLFHHSAPASAWIASKCFLERSFLTPVVLERRSMTGYGAGNLKFPCFQPTTATILRGMREKQVSLSIARLLSSQANHEPAKMGAPTSITSIAGCGSYMNTTATFIGDVIGYLIFGFFILPLSLLLMVFGCFIAPLFSLLLMVFGCFIAPLFSLLLMVFESLILPLFSLLLMVFGCFIAPMLWIIVEMLGFLILPLFSLLLMVFGCFIAPMLVFLILPLFSLLLMEFGCFIAPMLGFLILPLQSLYSFFHSLKSSVQTSSLDEKNKAIDKTKEK